MHVLYDLGMRTWMKAGIAGAIVYPIANIAFLFAALCGFASSSVICRLSGWIYFHLFPSEMLEEMFDLSSEVAWYGALIIADACIGFAIGALVAVLIDSIRRS
jgi:hypothetical protein